MKPRKNRKKTRVSPPVISGNSRGNSPGDFSGKLSGSVRNHPDFPPKFVGKTHVSKANSDEKSPLFLEKPRGICGGFLTGRCRKSFPQFSGKISPKFSCRNFFGNSQKFPKSFLTNFCGKIFPHFFFEKNFGNVYLPQKFFLTKKIKVVSCYL